MKKKTNLKPVDGGKAPEHGAGAGTPEWSESGAEFIRVEKDVITIGFFTPTSKELKKTRVKTVPFTQAVPGGHPVEVVIRIVTGGDYGLPGTADLDKWLAFQRHVGNLLKRDGVVTNPISFTSWELLSALNVHRRSGKNYGGVEEWLDRMCATTIEVKGEGKVGAQKRFGKDRGIQVFERGVSIGRELEPGVMADRNYVWLSDWQLANINNGFIIPIDFDAYLSLKNAIAKTLLPLLQVWLYATRNEGVFTKRYSDVCQLLGVTQYAKEWKIREKWGPSLDECVALGYLKGWGVENLRGTEGFKLVFRHGPKFYQDLESNRTRQGQITGWRPAPGEDSTALVEMLVERGVFKAVAQQLVSSRAQGQFIEDQVEWFDEMISRKGAERYKNPPGLLVTLVRLNVPIDPNFVTTRMRRLRAEYEARQREREAANEEAGEDGAQSQDDPAPHSDELEPRPPSEHDLYLLECRYREYVREEIMRHIERLPAGERKVLMETARLQFETEYRDAARVFKGAAATSVVAGIAERLVAPGVPVMSFEQFCVAEVGGAAGR
jgi:hypothetical protein